MKHINVKAAKRVRKLAHAEQARKWVRVMFSLDSGRFKAFKRVCDHEGLKYSQVVEEFMKFYVKTAKTERSSR